MYTDKVLNQLKKDLCNDDYKNNEYFQAVEEVFGSLNEVLTTEQINNKILERLTVPKQVHKFQVLWEDDKGVIQVNTGYRIQYNNSLGTLKGGLRFHPSVNEKILKFLAFEQTFKNSLTGLPMGGANIYTTIKLSSLQSQLNNNNNKYINNISFNNYISNNKLVS